LLEIIGLVTKPWAEAARLFWKVVTFALAGWLVLALPGAKAADSSLSPLTVVKQLDDLTVSTRLGDGLFATVHETITSGIPATFSYEIEIWRKNRLWADKSIVTQEIERAVRFNSLTNEYQVAEKSSSTSWERTSKSLQEVKDWVALVDSFPLVKFSDLVPEEIYYVRARAMVKTEQSPSTIKYMLFFLPRAKKTGWEQSEPFQVEEFEAAAAPPPALAPSATNR
jgi:hypothetical protein